MVFVWEGAAIARFEKNRRVRGRTMGMSWSMYMILGGVEVESFRDGQWSVGRMG